MNPTSPSTNSQVLLRPTSEVITLEIDESSSDCDTIVNIGYSEKSPQGSQRQVNEFLPPPSVCSSQPDSHLTQVICIEQIESDFVPIPWKSSTQRGQHSCEKDEKGRIVIRQPPEMDYLFQFFVGVISLFILPCLGVIILLSIFYTMEFNMIVGSEELTFNTFGAYWKNKGLETSISIPIRNVAVMRVVMDQAKKKDGLPDGKLFIITRDNLSIEVQKDYVNYYSVLAMAQKATEVINSNLNLMA